jgi:hypothetical protein
MKRRLLVWTTLLGILLPGSLYLAYGGRGGTSSSSSLTFNIFNPIVDEQNTTAFYNSGGTFCSGLINPVPGIAVFGDGRVTGPLTAYNMGSPWTLAIGFLTTSYINGTDCGTSCLKVVFGSKGSILTVDTRGASGPRSIQVNFLAPCGTADGCPGPAGSSTVFGGSVNTPGLLEVFMDFAYTSMAVCSSTTCPEAQPAFVKFWFADPTDSSVTWRIDWAHVRVLRLSSTTWYIIADACDGSQVAGLSKLSGSRTLPKAVLNGYYKIPFFVSANQ